MMRRTDSSYITVTNTSDYDIKPSDNDSAAHHRARRSRREELKPSPIEDPSPTPVSTIKSKQERSTSLDEIHREEELTRIVIMGEMRAEACKSRMMRRTTRRSGIVDGGLMICRGLAGLASKDD
jgi:hypothetical protein